MTYYVSPLIMTDEYQVNQTQDLTVIQEQRLALRAEPIDYGQQSYQHSGGIIEPDVPRHSGWAFPQINWPYITWVAQQSAPPYVQSSASYSSAIEAARNPVPTYSQTGVSGALRAPGINEGY